ncbi:MAG: NADH-quinone oxidoreductase subunit M [Chloroflexaceae bacterium]|nr:NADH-quinone oxidoreductase subunit M [Chloroflexaceae bacterium]
MASPEWMPPWLTLLMLSPLIGIALIGLAGVARVPDRLIKTFASTWTLVPLMMAIVVWVSFDANATSSGQGAVQFVEKIPWIQAVRVDYFVGVDGLSLAMVLLTTIMTPIAMLASMDVTHRVKLHFSLLLLLETAMLGYFLSLDFFFFFIFWEFSLVPAFFIIMIWGGEHRGRAAFKFFVYTVSGSIGMLLLFQFLYLATRSAGFPTFDLIALGRLGQGLPVEGISGDLATIIFNYAQELGITAYLGNNPLTYTSIAFWVIFIAFAIKLAVWPFHTWLPDTYTEAPTSGSILLSAVMSKMGAYGMLRILLPFVPDAAQQFAQVMGALALIGIVSGAFGALAHTRGSVKRLIGYTSINHMGYVMLAIAAVAALPGGASLDSRAIAVNGALMQMVAHGLSTGALFLLAGALYRRTHCSELTDFGGLRVVMPAFAGVMGMAMFANLGLPGLAGFVGEFFIFRGAWATLPFFTTLATIGLIFTALALLLMFQRIFLGPLNPRWRDLKKQDLSIYGLDFWAAVPLLALLLVFGIYPAPIMGLSNAAATEW